MTAVAISLIALLPTALAGASGGSATLKLQKTKVGTILVAKNGYTVYAFTLDKKNKDACAAIPQCLVAWPPVKKPSQLVLGPGVKKSLIGTIKLKHSVQLTYAGHALYTYVGDTHPAQTNFVNLLQFGGRWPAVNAAGKEIK